MYYSVKIKRVVVGENGNDKTIAETFITDVELFAEAEMKGLQEYNGECDVIAIKRLNNLREFVNDESDPDEYIYMATLTDTFVSETGVETETKYDVAVYAKDIKEANKRLDDYMNMGLQDLTLIGVKRTKIISVL